MVTWQERRRLRRQIQRYRARMQRWGWPYIIVVQTVAVIAVLMLWALLGPEAAELLELGYRFAATWL